ncbi:putative GMP synthase, partial [Daphnia magna]
IIVHRVRKQCVESYILALEIPGAFLLQQGYKAIIISVGPNSVYAVDADDPAIFRLRSSSAGNLLWQANTPQGMK